MTTRFPIGCPIQRLSPTKLRQFGAVPGIPTNRASSFATSAIRKRRTPTILKIFRADLRPHADFAYNPTDRETWFATSAMRIEKPPTMLMDFAFLFASLITDGVVQRVESKRFKTSSTKRTLQTFFETSFAQIA